MKLHSGEMMQLQYNSPVQETMEYTHLQSVVHPAMIGITSNDQVSLNAGFKDCADEAIRYLIEVENLSPEDPLVIGLKEHLEEQQRLYAFQQMFMEYNRLLASAENNRLDDSGVSVSIQGDSENNESSVSLQNETQHDCENLDKSGSNLSQNDTEISKELDIASITNLAEEILSLLGKDESLSDFEDDEFCVED